MEPVGGIERMKTGNHEGARAIAPNTVMSPGGGPDMSTESSGRVAGTRPSAPGPSLPFGA